MNNAATQDAQKEAHPLDPNAFATKLDLAELRTEFKGEMADLRAELKGEMADLRAELKGEIADVRLLVAKLEVRMNTWGAILLVVIPCLSTILSAILAALLKGAL